MSGLYANTNTVAFCMRDLSIYEFRCLQRSWKISLMVLRDDFLGKQYIEKECGRILVTAEVGYGSVVPGIILVSMTPFKIKSREEKGNGSPRISPFSFCLDIS